LRHPESATRFWRVRISCDARVPLHPHRRAKYGRKRSVRPNGARRLLHHPRRPRSRPPRRPTPRCQPTPVTRRQPGPRRAAAAAGLEEGPRLGPRRLTRPRSLGVLLGQPREQSVHLRRGQGGDPTGLDWRTTHCQASPATPIRATHHAWWRRAGKGFGRWGREAAVEAGARGHPRPSQRVDLAIEVLLGRRYPKDPDARGQAGARAPTIRLVLPLVATSPATPGCPGPGARRRPRPQRTGRLPRPPERSDRSCLPARSGNRRGTAGTALPAA